MIGIKKKQSSETINYSSFEEMVLAQPSQKLGTVYSVGNQYEYKLTALTNSQSDYLLQLPAQLSTTIIDERQFGFSISTQISVTSCADAVVVADQNTSTLYEIIKSQLTISEPFTHPSVTSPTLVRGTTSSNEVFVVSPLSGTITKLSCLGGIDFDSTLTATELVGTTDVASTGAELVLSVNASNNAVVLSRIDNSGTNEVKNVYTDAVKLAGLKRVIFDQNTQSAYVLSASYLTVFEIDETSPLNPTLNKIGELTGSFFGTNIDMVVGGEQAVIITQGTTSKILTISLSNPLSLTVLHELPYPSISANTKIKASDSFEIKDIFVGTFNATHFYRKETTDNFTKALTVEGSGANFEPYNSDKTIFSVFGTFFRITQYIDFVNVNLTDYPHRIIPPLSVEFGSESNVLGIDEFGKMKRLKNKASNGKLVGIEFQVADTRKTVAFQRTKSDSELIQLFGAVGNGGIEVDQSEVVYDVEGVYNVYFIFNEETRITCKLEIKQLLTFDKPTLEELTQTINNPDNLVTLYNLPFNFATYTVALNGATSPVITGNLHEWIKRPLSDIDKVEILFTNVATLSSGKTLNCKISFINYDVYSYNAANQKWGFDVIGGSIIFKQAGFINFEPKFEFTNEDGDIVYLNVATRIDNVHFAKHVGAEVGAEFFVSSDTLLLGEEFDHPNSSIPVFIASRFEGDGDIIGADNIALGIAKQNTSSFNIVYGKDYTSNILFDLSTTAYLDLPVTMRARQAPSTEEKQFIYEESTTPILVTDAVSQVILTTFPAGTFIDGRKYEIRAAANYTRTDGNNNTSTIGFRLVQGAVFKFDGFVSIVKDDVSATLCVPQLVKQYTFNSTQTVLLEAYMLTGEPDVTIDNFEISFTEV